MLSLLKTTMPLDFRKDFKRKTAPSIRDGRHMLKVRATVYSPLRICVQILANTRVHNNNNNNNNNDNNKNIILYVILLYKYDDDGDDDDDHHDHVLCVPVLPNNARGAGGSGASIFKRYASVGGRLSIRPDSLPAR
ncbi:hypothetical protein QTP88_003455 [Uroleucon formosanum]